HLRHRQRMTSLLPVLVWPNQFPGPPCDTSWIFVMLENNWQPLSASPVLPSGYGPAENNGTFDLPTRNGDDCPSCANTFSDGLEKLQEEGAIAESVRGPTNWESLIRKHREVLNISLDTPETKRILLKTKKLVNACLRR